VPKKIIFKKLKNGQQCYIPRIRGGGTPEGGVMELGTFVDVQNVINHAKFHLHQMNSVQASGESKI
jgi:hypothetical protein